MIDKKELRVGNNLLYIPNGYYILVESINYEGINNWDMAASGCEPYNKLSGIPLTEEILLKCGFKKRAHCYDWFIRLPESETILSYIGDQLRLCPVNSGPSLYMDCSYLHELQNIYYWLSGKKELEVNL